MAGSLDNFGIQFAAKTLRKFYQEANTPAITNTDYEGDIKKAGDRVRILQFLSDITLNDYSAGTDMNTENIVDDESELVVEKRKYYNFDIDRLEDLFTYGDDVADTLVENASKVIERTIDTYVLDKMADGARAGNWVGLDLRITGSASDTEASVSTTSTGGTVSVSHSVTNNAGATVENSIDGNFYHGGFTDPEDVNKAIRLTSGSSWATEWYRISSVTDTTTVDVVNWDGATSGSDIPNGDILRGLYGAVEFTGGDLNGDGKPTTEAGWGWELQAANATATTASNIYSQIVKLAEALDDDETPDTDRHVTFPPQGIEMLRNASELQPAIAMAYEGVVINGRVGRVGAMDVHMATGARVTQRAGHQTSDGADGALDASTQSAGASGYQVVANHRSFCTFGYKWAQSRIVDAEAQFAKKYQGLHLYGALVPLQRRAHGAVLFTTF